MERRGRPKGARAVPRWIVEEIEEEARWGATAAEIHRDGKPRWGDATPSDRTVRDIVQKRLDEDLSGPWSPVDATDPEAAEAALQVLRDVVIASNGRATSITKAEAEVVGRLARHTPKLRALVLWKLARLYVKRRQSKESTADLDIYLSFAPWLEGYRPGEVYAEEVAAGRIPPAPPFLPGVPEPEWDYSAQESIQARLAEIKTRLDVEEPLWKGNDPA